VPFAPREGHRREGFSVRGWGDKRHARAGRRRRAHVLGRSTLRFRDLRADRRFVATDAVRGRPSGRAATPGSGRERHAAVGSHCGSRLCTGHGEHHGRRGPLVDGRRLADLATNGRERSTGLPAGPFPCHRWGFQAALPSGPGGGRPGLHQRRGLVRDGQLAGAATIAVLRPATAGFTTRGPTARSSAADPQEVADQTVPRPRSGPRRARPRVQQQRTTPPGSDPRPHPGRPRTGPEMNDVPGHL
jgi:hypothetical protein